MTEYISREAAKEALYKTAEEYDEYDKCDRIAIIALNNADEIVNDIPAADVVEVVRCRECVLSRKPDRRKPAENRACEGTLICSVGFDHVHPDTDDGLIFVDEYFYCAEGKRKDGGQDE